MTIEITQDAAVTYRQKPEDRRIIERKDAGGRWKYYAEHKTADAAKVALVALANAPLEAMIRQTDMQVESKPPLAALASEYGALVYEYEQIKPTVRERVKNAAIIIRKLRRRIIADILIMGRELIEVKAMLEHGKFLDWIEIEFKMSDRTARNYMYAAEQYGGKSEIISDLDATVVYLLAAPSTPNEARFEIEERIRITGDLPTRDQIKIIIEAYKPVKLKQLPPPPEPEPAIDAEYTVMPEPERIIAQLADPHTTPIQLAALFDEATAEQLQAALDLLPEDADTRHDSLYRQMLKRRRLDEAHAAMLTPPKWASASERQIDLLARVIAVKGLLHEIEQQQPGLRQAVEDVAGPLKRLIGMLEGKLR